MIKVICRRSSSCLATVSMLSSFNPEFYLPHKGPRQDWQIKRRETRASARWGLKNFPSPLRRRQERKQFRGKWHFEIIRRRSNWRIFYLGGALIGLQRDVLFDFFRLSQPASQSKNQCDLFVVWGTFRVHQAAVVGRKWSEMIRETPPTTSQNRKSRFCPVLQPDHCIVLFFSLFTPDIMQPELHFYQNISIIPRSILRRDQLFQ